MSQQHINDFWGDYLSEEAILGQAEAILRKRLERQGKIDQPGDASRFLRVRLAHLDHEEFHVVFLDSRHRIIAVEAMFRGTIDGAEVHPREVVRAALRCATRLPPSSPATTTLRATRRPAPSTAPSPPA